MSAPLSLALAAFLVIAAAAATSVLRRQELARAQLFFPLASESQWTYLVKSRSEQLNYRVVDRARGEQFIEKLRQRCQVVDETYEMDRGGMRPVIYYSKDGFLSRLSGLEYVGKRIEFPVWTLSLDKDFLPLDLRPDQAWSNRILPYGNMPDAPTITQSHKSFVEKREILVPAGRYSDCLRVETHAVFQGGPYKQPLALDYFDWYAPHVSLVKTLATEGGTTGKVVELVELLKFETPGGPNSSN